MKITSELELQELTDVVMGLSALKFFPQAEQGLVAIVSDVAGLVSSMERARWLVKRMRELFDEWPGPVSMRETYIERFPAADEQPAYIQSGNQKYLPIGVSWEDKEATRGPWPEELLMPAKPPSRKTPKETPLLIPGKDFKPITADDIEEVRRKLAQERAQDLG